MDNDPRSDSELVTAYLGGSDEAFWVLVRKHHPQVTRIVWRLLGGIADGAQEEVVNNVFFKAWRSLTSYSDTYPFSAWLKAIATNEAVDHLRVRQRRYEHETALDTLVNEPEAHENARPDHLLEEAERKKNRRWRDATLEIAHEKYRLRLAAWVTQHLSAERDTKCRCVLLHQLDGSRGQWHLIFSKCGHKNANTSRVSALRAVHRVLATSLQAREEARQLADAITAEFAPYPQVADICFDFLGVMKLGKLKALVNAS